MAILRYILAVFGYGWFIGINVLSYTHPSFQGDIQTKFLYSLLSFVLLTLDVIVLVIPKAVTKRHWTELSLYTRISVVVGLFILPLMSLYYS